MDEFELRTDPSITTADDAFVSPEDWHDFHRVIDDSGGGVSVAVMDSGIDDTHPIFDYYDVDVHKPDIDGLPTNGEDNVGHGTGAMGTALYMGQNIDEIYDVPIFGNSGRTETGTIVRAYEWLIENSDSYDFVNMSWGSPQKVPAIDRMHNELEQTGVDAVVAAGNTDQQTGSPATADRAFAVAACTLDGRMTRWSSPTDNVAALGKNIAMPKSSNGEMGKKIPRSEYSPLMKEIGGKWIKASGTSFACPGTLGMAAMFRANHTNLLRKDVSKPFEQRFSETALDIKGTDEDGEGYIDYAAAARSSDDTDPVTANASVYSMPWSKRDIVFIDYNVFDDGKYDVDVKKMREAITKK